MNGRDWHLREKTYENLQKTVSDRTQAIIEWYENFTVMVGRTYGIENVMINSGRDILREIISAGRTMKFLKKPELLF